MELNELVGEPTMTGRFRIVRTPDGEAPLEIRRKWVGLELPCYPLVGYTDGQKGIMTGQKLLRSRSVVVVDQDVALAILAKKSSNAALWWRQQGFPKAGKCFAFGEDEVEIICGVKDQKLSRWDDIERQFVP